jgi:hypothetical protein
MAEHLGQNAEPLPAVANVAPPDFAGQTRILINAIEGTVADLKADVREIRNHRVTDLLWHIGVFAGGFLILASAMIFAYFKIEEKTSALTTVTTRVETKLDDLVARLPPVVAPIPRKAN